MTRRSPEQMFNLKRSKEGRDLELYAVPAALETDGYEVNFSHRSHGPYDHAAWKPGQLLLIGARLTGVDRTNPTFTATEINTLWQLASANTRPGFDVIPLIATAYHAPTVDRLGQPGPCRCQHTHPDLIDPIRYLQLTGPAVGRGQRANWKPWTPDYAIGQLATV